MQPDLPERLSVRAMEPADLHSVVAVHLQSFPDFFLSFLGPRFLSLYYEYICRSTDGIACVCEASTGVIGFVAGSANPRGFYRRLLRRRWLGFAVAAIPALARRPTIAMRLLRALRYPGTQSPHSREAGLYSIGVSPSAQNRGVGAKLVDAFVRECRRRGCDSVTLKTDANGNESTNAFYRRRGFALQGQELTPEGRLMNRYVLRIGI